MGYEVASVGISATLSRHNSERDDKHTALWDELVKEVQAIVDNPKYREIGAEWFGGRYP